MYVFLDPFIHFFKKNQLHLLQFQLKKQNDHIDKCIFPPETNGEFDNGV